MMYKVTIFERYTQPQQRFQHVVTGCYDVQSYNFWKIYTTSAIGWSGALSLLWCTKLQFLKDIHNELVCPHTFARVVMMYKVTIFERYTQPVLDHASIQRVVMMYKVTIFERYTQQYGI